MKETHKEEWQGQWIPARIWNHEALSWVERCLWATIDSLQKLDKNGRVIQGCFASNEWLAERMGCKERAIQQMLSNLVAAGCIERYGFDGRRRDLRTQGCIDLHPRGVENPTPGVSKTPPLGCRNPHPESKGECKGESKGEKQKGDPASADETPSAENPDPEGDRPSKSGLSADDSVQSAFDARGRQVSLPRCCVLNSGLENRDYPYQDVWLDYCEALKGALKPESFEYQVKQSKKRLKEYHPSRREEGLVYAMRTPGKIVNIANRISKSPMNDGEQAGSTEINVNPKDLPWV